MSYPSHDIIWDSQHTSMGIVIKNLGASTINKNEVVGWDVPHAFVAGHRGSGDTHVIGIAATAIAPSAYGQVRRVGSMVSVIVTGAAALGDALGSTALGAAYVVDITTQEWLTRNVAFGFVAATAAGVGRRTIKCHLFPWRI